LSIAFASRHVPFPSPATWWQALLAACQPGLLQENAFGHRRSLAAVLRDFQRRAVREVLASCSPAPLAVAWKRVLALFAQQQLFFSTSLLEFDFVTF